MPSSLLLEITKMITWFAIVFTDNSTGYQKMQDGTCIGVYRADGTVISPEEAVEYTCTNDNATAPDWA
jgi:hypothetical protein